MKMQNLHKVMEQLKSKQLAGISFVKQDKKGGDNPSFFIKHIIYYPE